LAIANFYWTAGRAAETEAALNRALLLDPESVVAHRALAVFAMSRNRTSDAETHLKRVVELTKSNDASLTLADFYVSQRNEPAARAILGSLANGDGGIATLARIRLASLDHIDGRKDEAYARLDEVLSRNRVNVDALLVKGYLLIQDKRLDEALTTVTTAVEAQKDSVAALYLRGRVYRMRHESEAAINDFESVLRLNPRATAARVELAQLHLAAGRSEASVAFAEEAAKADPKGGQTQLLLAKGLLAKGDVQRAESIVSRLVTEFPRSSAVLTQQGMLRARRGDVENARKSFEQALALDPSALEAVAGLVGLDLKAGRAAAARARADREVARANGAIPSLMLAARTYMLTGDSGTAEDLLRKALASDAGHLPAYAALGQIYASERRLDAALREFDALAARDPRNVQALTVAAILVEAQGRLPEAKKRYERVLQMDPNAAVAANNLAWAYANGGGDLDRALELARIAHRELPDTSEVADTLGYVYLKKGMLPEAIEILTDTVAKHPDAYQSHFHLGLAMERSDDQKAAVKHLTEALRLKPDFDGASEARERLRSIESR
jgi:tetratricopeptide (TPR) repeat protein